MSVQASQWAWRQSEALRLPIGELVQLLHLADRSDADGVCFPSVDDIQRRTGLHPRTIRLQNQRLAAKGLLRIGPRFRDNGSQTSNGFFLLISGDEEVPDHEDRMRIDPPSAPAPERGGDESRVQGGDESSTQGGDESRVQGGVESSTHPHNHHLNHHLNREKKWEGVAPASPPPTPLPLFGEPEQSGIPPSTPPSASTSPTPQAMVAAWNAAVADTPLPQAILSGKRAGLLARAARHPAIGTLETWEALCRAIADDEFHRGERPGGFPATIDQATNPGTIERMTAKMNAPPPPRDWSDVPASEFGPEDVPTGEPPVDDLEMGRLCNPFADLGISWDEHMADVRAGIVECRDIERGRAGGAGIQQEHHHAPAAE